MLTNKLCSFWSQTASNKSSVTPEIESNWIFVGSLEFELERFIYIWHRMWRLRKFFFYWILKLLGHVLLWWLKWMCADVSREQSFLWTELLCVCACVLMPSQGQLLFQLSVSSAHANFVLHFFFFYLDALMEAWNCFVIKSLRDKTRTFELVNWFESACRF